MQLDPNVDTSPASVSRRNFLTGAAGLAFTISIGSGILKSGIADAKSADAALQTAWVIIQPDGVITIMSAASEMGQGSMTSLPLIIAEELDADWSKVRVEMSPSIDKIYGNPMFKMSMYTAGSSSVREYFKPLRLQGAQIRRVLLDIAAKEWNVLREQLSTEPSVVVHRASGKRLTYGQIAKTAKLPSVLPEVQESDLKDPKNFRYIGKDSMRVELPTKVNGSAIYSIDVQVPGMLYGAVLRAPVEGSVPESVSVSAARALPGVVDVVRLPYGVAVVANRPDVAFAAKDALKVTWSKVAASTFDDTSALQRYVDAARDLKRPGKPWETAGDVAKAEPQAKTILEAEYRTDFVYHAQMEPLNSVAAVNAEGAEIWAGTQAPVKAIEAVARAIGIAPEKVVLHRTLLGGGFGRRGHFDHEFVVDSALLSKAVKKPVKVIWTREDDVRNGRFRPMTGQYLRAGLDAEGRIISWHHRISSEEALKFQDSVRYKALGGLGLFAMLGSELPSYDLPNHLMEHVHQDDGMRLSSLRGTGNPHNMFAIESFVDEIAIHEKLDPLAFRLRMLDKDPRAQAVLKTAADMAGWGRQLPAGRGLGLCFRNEDKTLTAMVAEVSVDVTTGQAKVHNVWAAADVGLAVQPDNVVAQIEGAITFTLGACLSERITMKDGAVEQSNFYDYQVPRMKDLPEITVKLAATTNAPTGIGEMGCGVVGAVANAISRAAGARIRHMPMTADRVLAAIKATKRAG